ncbi:MAG TPA: hypothetical protein VFE65_04290 [Pseudonocardia sp.]|jgi:hypothetical protein|nr:hypothetical protein [Pseudonocardia sp.]
MTSDDLFDDVVLTPLERRRWKRLRRQLETGQTGPQITPRGIAVSVAVVLLIGGAVLGGPAGVAAVAAYLVFCLGLYGLQRLLWRSGREPEVS